MKKAIKIKITIICILFVIAGLVLLLPSSRFYVGKCLKVEMRVKVNNEYVIPENITCTNGVGEPKKTRVVNNKDGVTVYINAYHHGINKVSYDVNTPEGVKHFTYDIMKTHGWGPRDNFRYRNELQQNDEMEWYANVWLEKKDAEAGATTIKLSEDENAHVHYGA